MSKKNKNKKPKTPYISKDKIRTLPAGEVVAVPEVTPEIKTGRPCDYEKKVKPYLHKIGSWVLLGYTNLQIAEKLDISEDTFYKYKKEFSEFSESVDKNKPLADDVIVNSLYQKAQTRIIEVLETTKESILIKDKKTGKEKPAYDDKGNPLIKEKTYIKKVVLAADTKAAMFWLMNRDPDNWRSKPDGNNININNNNDNNAIAAAQNNNTINHLSPDDLKAKIRNFIEVRSNND